MFCHDLGGLAGGQNCLSQNCPMTEILFYHLKGQTPEQVLPTLLLKSLERGWRVVVQA